jgi:[acyl-carrier-protein] S-malonyltransferase
VKSLAFVFPGQGAQHVGMARDLRPLPFIERELLETMAGGPEAALDCTARAQPAIFAASLMALEAWRARRPDLAPDCVAGHSMGEITALAVAGAISYADGYAIVKERGRLMATTAPGGMTVIIGLDLGVVRALLDAQGVSADVEIANHNSEKQIVLAGPPELLARVEAAARKSAKIVQRLPISIAAHSRLMAPIQAPFAEFLETIPFAEARIPFFNSHDGGVLTRPDELRDHLVRQLVRGVMWVSVAHSFRRIGIDTAVELGGEKTVKLLSRSLPDLRFWGVWDQPSLAAAARDFQERP